MFTPQNINHMYVLASSQNYLEINPLLTRQKEQFLYPLKLNQQSHNFVNQKLQKKIKRKEKTD